jgi:hypothetical protein
MLTIINKHSLAVNPKTGYKILMSIYCMDRKFIFLHIPKNAGTSIRKNLSDVADVRSFDEHDEKTRVVRDQAYANHFPYWKIQELVDKDDLGIPIEDFRTFMVVRNPWERMVSLYEHRMRKLHWEYEGKPRNDPASIAVAEQGFEAWLLGTPHEGDKVLTRTPQISWGKSLDGRVPLSFFIRQDRLDDPYEWRMICKHLGVDHTPLPKMNSGSPRRARRGYREHYSDKARDHVAEYFKEDVEWFDYEF